MGIFHSGCQRRQGQFSRHTNARPDETIIIDVALKFLQGNLTPAFYDYPWLYMWVLAGLYLLYGVWGRATGAGAYSGCGR